MTGGEQQGWVIDPTFLHERNGWLYKCFGHKRKPTLSSMVREPQFPIWLLKSGAVEDNQNSNMEDAQHHTTTAIIHPVGRGLFKLIS